MTIALLSVGTRGDVEPFLAVAELLRERGHAVTCAVPEQYRRLATDRGLECIGLTPRFLELVEGEAGKSYMGGGGNLWSRGKSLWYLFREGLRVNRQLVREQQRILEDGFFDRVIFHPKACFPFVWSVANPGRAAALSPVPWVIHPIPGHPHLGFSWLRDVVPVRWTYKLANAGLARNVLSATGEYRKLHGISSAAVKRAILRVPVAYHVSPALLQPPAAWPEHVRALGFHPRHAGATPDISSALTDFIKRHPRFIVITFGSMVNPDPARTTRTILEALDRVEIPAVINRAGGGLSAPSNYARERVHFAEYLDYDRVFPTAAAVVHHGGAGTTHTGLLHGCPTLIVPHIIDQFVWARLVRERGLGPAALPVRELSAERLAERLQDLCTHPGYRTAAREMGNRMRSEDYADDLCRFLTGGATR